MSKGIIWFLSGSDKDKWLQINLKRIKNFIKNRKHDKIVIVSNNVDVSKYKEDRVITCYFNYNAYTFIGNKSMGFSMGVNDMLCVGNSIIKSLINKDIGGVVSFHWDVIINDFEKVVNLVERINTENKDFALYYRAVNVGLQEDVSPHTFFIISTSKEYSNGLWFKVGEYVDKGFERGFRSFLIQKYGKEIFPEHPKIVSVGIIDYYTKEQTHFHTHQFSTLQQWLREKGVVL